MYRIGGDNEYDIDLGGHKVLEAVFEVTAEAHEGQTRDDDVTAYITHPILVYKILDRFGCDIKTKTIGLLHDTLEDDKKLGRDPQKLSAALHKALLPKYPNKPNLKQWCDSVAERVNELTNPIFYTGGGKRDSQVDHVRTMPRRVQNVKIADQAATVISDILHCDPYNTKALEKAIRFALKGHDIVQAVESQTENEPNPFSLFYNQLYQKLRTLYGITQNHELTAEQQAEEIQKLREGLTEDYFLDLASAIKANPGNFTSEPMDKNYPVTCECPADQLLYMKKGIQNVKIIFTPDEEFQVTGYGVLIDEDTGLENTKNRTADMLREICEETPGVIVDTHRIHEKKLLMDRGTVAVRNYAFTEPMPLSQFIDLAESAEALGVAMKGEIKQEINQIHREIHGVEEAQRSARER